MDTEGRRRNQQRLNAAERSGGDYRTSGAAIKSAEWQKLSNPLPTEYFSNKLKQTGESEQSRRATSKSPLTK
jgi:hypothetical protein